MKNKKKHPKKLPFILLALLAPLAILNAAKTPVYARTSPWNEKITIRVGFFQFDGYHEIAENGAMSGYGYDFLQMIAPYAGFEYEYIGYDKSWSEMQQMLERGK